MRRWLLYGEFAAVFVLVIAAYVGGLFTSFG